MTHQALDNMPIDTNMLTVRDVALYLRLSEAKVYRMAREGSVPAFRVGKSWRFRRDVIDEWIRRGTSWPTASPAAKL
jgi:excisionase family DNA binding protein